MAKVVKKTNKKPLSRSSRSLTSEEKFWDEVDLLAQKEIYQILTRSIPFQNIPLIAEPYHYKDEQQKKVGLFLHTDTDYRTLLADMESQYSEEKLPNKETLAEEIAIWYCQMVIKSLISDLSDYSCYNPSFFENLTEF